MIVRFGRQAPVSPELDRLVLRLLEKEPPASADIPLLLRDALDKIAFFPFGIMMDKWRWQVFSGETTPDEYNKAWWDLKAKYQGVAPVEARGEDFFDPGAKYHVPGNTPYTRYFLSHVLQFQFYKALCDEAGHTGPLYTCSFANNPEAGRKYMAMLERGASQPWQQTLKELTGGEQMDGSAVLEQRVTGLEASRTKVERVVLESGRVLDADVVVPGHGALTDKSGIREFRDYLQYVYDESRKCYDEGLDFEQAAEKISLDPWAHFAEDERMYINVYACYREFRNAPQEKPDFQKMLGLMGKRHFSKHGTTS